MCQRDSKCEMRAMKEMVAGIEDKMVVLLTAMKNLEEQVVPGINSRLGRLERGEGEEGCACGDGGCICEAYTTKNIKVEEQEEAEEQTKEVPKETGEERQGQAVEAGEDGSSDEGTLEEATGELEKEVAVVPAVEEIWRRVKKEKARRGSQDSRYKREQHVELLISIDPRAGPVLRILGVEEGVQHCIRFQSSVLADMNIRISDTVSARDRRRLRTDEKFCRDRLYLKAERLAKGGSLLLLDWEGGVRHVQERARGRMARCPRERDTVAAVREAWELVAERQRKDLRELTGTVAEEALVFARDQVSMGMTHKWAELMSLGDSLLRVACGSLQLRVEGLEMAGAEGAWGKEVKDAISGLAVGASVLGESIDWRRYLGLTLFVSGGEAEKELLRSLRDVCDHYGVEAGGDAAVSMELGPEGVKWWVPASSAKWWASAVNHMGKARSDDIKRAVGEGATWAKDIALRGMVVRQADTSLFGYKRALPRAVRQKRGAES